MHEARFGIEPMCTSMPKCHWLPFLVGCMSGSRALSRFFVEGGAAIKVASTADGAFTHPQALLGQLPIDDLENPERQFVGFEFVLKLEQSGGVRSLLTPQVDADEEDRVTVVDGILDTLIGKAGALFSHIHP